MRVEADAHLRWRDPARELHQRVRVRQLQGGLLLDLADAREPVRRVPLAVARVDRAAREHPRAAHEALRRIAPDQQDLERVAPAPQDDHGRGLARRRRLARVELGPGLGSVDGHRLTLLGGMDGRCRSTSASRCATGACRSRGATPARWPSASAPRSTSSPRISCAAARGRSPGRSAPRGRTGRCACCRRSRPTTRSRCARCPPTRASAATRSAPASSRPRCGAAPRRR